MEMPMPDDWNGEDTCRWAICWPNSPKWQAILSGLIETPNQGRFWDFDTGNFLALRASFRKVYDYNFTLKETIMACNDTGLSDVAVAIQSLANSVASIALSIVNNQNVACCDKRGSGGAGESQPPFNETTPGDPQSDPPPGTWETWEQFLSDKCALSHIIVDKLRGDLASMAILQFATFDIGALAALIAVIIATPVPFDDLLALAGLLLAIGATIVITSTLDIINQNEEELVCVLYNSVNASGASSDFLTVFSGYADAYFNDPIEKFVSKEIVRYFVGPQVTNELFVQNTAVSYPASDCSQCEEDTCIDGDWYVQWGTVNSDDVVNDQRIMDIDGANNGTYYQLVVFTYPQGGSATCAVKLADLSTDAPGFGLPYAGEANSDHHLGFIIDAPGGQVVYFKTVEEAIAFDNFYAVILEGATGGWGAILTFENA